MQVGSFISTPANPGADMIGGQVNTSGTQLAFAASGPQPASLYNGMPDAKIMWRIVMGGDFSALAEANRRGIFISENTANILKRKVAASAKQGTPAAPWIISAVNTMKIEAQSTTDRRAANIQNANTIRKVLLQRKRHPNYVPTNTARIREKNVFVDTAVTNAGGDAATVLAPTTAPDYTPSVYTPPVYTSPEVISKPFVPTQKKSDYDAPTPPPEFEPKSLLETSTNSFVVPGTGGSGGMLPYSFNEFDKVADVSQTAIEEPTNWPLIIGGGGAAIALLLILTRKKAK